MTDLAGAHDGPIDPAPKAASRSVRRRSVLPGFGLSMGITLTYLGIIVLVPLSMIVLKTSTLGWSRFWDTALAPRAVASYGLSFGASLVSALINAFFGVLL